MNKEIFKIIQQNSKIYNLVRNYEGSEKNFLKEKCGVSIPTINKALGELERNDLIISSEGKYWINREAFFLIGISIGSAQSKILVLDAGFNVISKEKFSKFRELIIERLENVVDKNDNFFLKCKEEMLPYVYYSTPGDFVGNKMCLDSIFSSIKYALENVDEYKLNILSIGLSSTGLVNRERQEIVEAHNAVCMEHESIDTLLFDDLKKFLELKEINIHLEQNSKAAAIAEKEDLYRRNSSLKNANNMASLYLGAGIGCGLILNGKVFYGKSGYSGEISHLLVPDVVNEMELQNIVHLENSIDEKCTCGRVKCFDYIIRRYIFGKGKKEFSKMSSNQVADYLANEKNQYQRDIFAKYLGAICEMLSNLLNVELIIFTGKFHKCEEILTKNLDIEKDKNVLRYNANDCKFCFSRLGASAPAIGSAIAAYYDKIGEEVIWY